MKRLFATLFVSSALTLAATSALAKPPAKNATASTPQVQSLNTFIDGFQFGMTRLELTRAVVAPGGAVDKLYDPELRKAAPGVQQRAIETERESVKSSFKLSLMEFNVNSPSGLDAGPLRREYTYGNRESAMVLQSANRKRYFFFINDKLWKVYDEIALGSDPALGNTFPEIEAKLSTKLTTSPRRNDESGYLELDWQDMITHLRLVDRSAERIVGIVVEERATLNNLAALRTAKLADPFAIDPAILAVTKSGLSDPNQQKAPEEQPEEGSKKKKKK